MIKRGNKTAYNQEVTETMSAPTAYILKNTEEFLGCHLFHSTMLLASKKKVFCLNQNPIIQDV